MFLRKCANKDFLIMFSCVIYKEENLENFKIWFF